MAVRRRRRAAGTSSKQRGSAKGQRVAKRQPRGSSPGGGTEPEIVASRPDFASSEGIELISPIV